MVSMNLHLVFVLPALRVSPAGMGLLSPALLVSIRMRLVWPHARVVRPVLSASLVRKSVLLVDPLPMLTPLALSVSLVVRTSTGSRVSLAMLLLASMTMTLQRSVLLGSTVMAWVAFLSTVLKDTIPLVV